MTDAAKHSGCLEAIWLKRFHRGPMDARERVRAIAGRGLEGNSDQGGKRQVTLLDAERWEEVCRELGEDLDPRLRRANLYLRGIDLRGGRGRVLLIGACRILVHGETRPCHLMDEAHPGLRRALDPDWGGGAYGGVDNGAEIRLGDFARWA